MPTNSVATFPTPRRPGRGRPPSGPPLWLYQLVQYMELMPGRLSPEQRTAKASEFAGHPIVEGSVRNALSKHRAKLDEFRQLIATEQWAQAAKKRLEGMSLDGVDIYGLSLQSLKAKLALDIPAKADNADIALALKAAEPILDRVWPKKSEAPVTAVQIVLSGKQQAAIAAVLDDTDPLPEVTGEVLEEDETPVE